MMQIHPASPLVITVNVDIESQDAAIAGGAGLYGRFSFGRYGAREGVWRLLDALAAEAMPATFFVDGEDAGRHPAVVAAICDAGHEIALLGSPGLEDVNDPARLAAWIGQARDALEQAAGRKVSGWRAGQGVLSEETLPVLAELGFDYDSSQLDDDHPYLFGTPGGASLVEIPGFRFLSDTTYFHARRTDATVCKAWAEELVALRAAGSLILMTVHSRGDFGCGRALRARMFHDWLHRARTTPGVEVMTCATLSARTRAAGLTPEPFPRLDVFAADMPPAPG